MKIVYLGSGQFGIDCLNAIKNSPHSIKMIVTQPPHPAGRGKALRPTPVSCWAKTNNIPLIETDKVNEPSTIHKISETNPDLIVVIAFGQKIGDPIINTPPKGIINVHASLLPKFRGAAPINTAIIQGEKTTGNSIITVAQKMDAGDILAQNSTEIKQNENAGQLHDRLATLAAPLLIDTINKIEEGSAVYTKQDDTRATKAPKLKKSDGFIDFNDSAQNIKQKILGLSPWPQASASYIQKVSQKCENVILADAEVVEYCNPVNNTPGMLNENLHIICKQNALKITKIKPAGKKLMSFADFINGRCCLPGDLFIKIEKNL